MPYRDRRRLTMLEGVRVSAPCPERWEDMIGDARVRFCGRCAKNVYDLSAMSREEAETFVREEEGSVCVTLRRRGDGRVLTNDCPVGARARRRCGFAALALVLFGVSLALVLHDEDEPSVRSEPRSNAHAPPRAFVHRHEAVDFGGSATTGVHVLSVDVGLPDRGGRTTGCLCRPGDALCACM